MRRRLPPPSITGGTGTLAKAANTMTAAFFQIKDRGSQLRSATFVSAGQTAFDPACQGGTCSVVSLCATACSSPSPQPSPDEQALLWMAGNDYRAVVAAFQNRLSGCRAAGCHCRGAMQEWRLSCRIGRTVFRKNKSSERELQTPEEAMHQKMGQSRSKLFTHTEYSGRVRLPCIRRSFLFTSWRAEWIWLPSMWCSCGVAEDQARP